MSDGRSFEFAKPDLFTAGAIGPPGQRVFYLQAREGAQLVTLKCEKEQVGALGEYLGRLLERLGSPPGGSQDLALHEPVNAAWVVGSIAVAYDEDADRVVLVLEELADPEEPEADATEGEAAGTAEPPAADAGESESAGASGRIRLTRAQAAAFVERARALVRAGRPSCRLCGRPMNPGGHRCARTNGHHVD